jgi:uncharacterized protein (TIGR02145 family)
MARNLNYQKGLTWQANSDMPTTTAGQDLGLIGHFWCPGGYSSTTTISTRESCDVWGALYSWETAMSYDGKGAWTESPSTYNSGAANSDAAKVNHGRTASGSGRSGRGICPPNWHVPTDYEWGIVLDDMESAGGTAHQNAASTVSYGKDAGSRGKSKCTVPDISTSGNTYVNDTQANWYYASGALGTDVYGYRVLPTGNRRHVGTAYQRRGEHAQFWSSTPGLPDRAYYTEYRYNAATTIRLNGSRSFGFSVRCIRD